MTTLSWLTPSEPGRLRDSRSYEPAEQHLVDNRERVETWVLVDDPNGGYDYDEIAIVSLDDQFYFLQAAGCSCNSPHETWAITQGPIANPTDILKGVIEGEYSGYTIPPWAMGELLRGLSLAIVSQS